MGDHSTNNRSNRQDTFGDWLWLARSNGRKGVLGGRDRLIAAVMLRAAGVLTAIALVAVVIGCNPSATEPALASSTQSESNATGVGAMAPSTDGKEASESRSPESVAANPPIANGELGAREPVDVDSRAPSERDGKRPSSTSLSERLLRAAREHAINQEAEAPVERREVAAAPYTPPYPEREEMFLAPQIEVNTKTARAVSSLARAALKGIVDLGGQQALIEIEGHVYHLRENEQLRGVTVVSINPPQVTLKQGESQWTESLSDAQQATTKTKSRTTN